MKEGIGADLGAAPLRRFVRVANMSGRHLLGYVGVRRLVRCY